MRGGFLSPLKARSFGACLFGGRNAWLRILGGLCLCVVTIALLDTLFPPPLHKGEAVSPLVLDRNGHWVHGFTTKDGQWRLRAELDRIDPVFLERLILIEDKRFYHHGGVDLMAIARAAWGSARHRRIVSGASTITMQTARLLEPRPRNLGSKLIEMLRALQIERRLSKDEILSLYLTLAPYGGNLQGVRAASLAWFDSEPAMLTSAQQALLIALPQAPEARRPDRKPDNARNARAFILDRLTGYGAITKAHAGEAGAAPIIAQKHLYPRAAWHLAYEVSHGGPQIAKPAAPPQAVLLTLDLGLQTRTEKLIADYSATLVDGASAAAIIVENRTRAVRVLVGSSGTDVPGGWIDLTRAERSPGSALKPFIYALAFEDGTLHGDSIVGDMAHSFGGYSPENFDRKFRGEVRVREALQHSLNVPAVAALEQVGSARFSAALEMAGAALALPGAADAAPGLALALGGAGIRMRQMAMLYSALATDGTVKRLRYRLDDPQTAQSYRLMSHRTARTIADILRSAPSLKGRVPANLTERAPDVAFKTGTSYGYRDAWAAGFDDQYTVIIWVGRADGAPRPGRTGRNSAASLLFSIFDMLEVNGDHLTAGSDEGARSRRAAHTPGPARPVRALPAPALEIIFPTDGVEIFLDRPGEDNTPRRGLALAARGGQGHAQWYVDGRKIARDPLGGRYLWYPDQQGFYTLSVVDMAGQSRAVNVRVRAPS